MTPYLHNQVIDTLKNNKVTEEKWSQLIEPLKQDVIKDLEYIDKRQLERLLKKIRKEFGHIEKGNEDPYLEGLYAFENNLSIQAQYYGLNSRHIKKLLKHGLLFCMDVIKMSNMIYLIRLMMI